MKPPLRKVTAKCRHCGRPFVSLYRTKRFFYCSSFCHTTVVRQKELINARNKRVRRHMERIAAKAAQEIGASI